MTTESKSKPKYLSREIDYLGNLNAKLRDLQGYRTLAHELIQNADDAVNATSITFDVCDEELIVDNDGTFSDCGNVEARECLWESDGTHNHRCDFHRIRYIGAGDKRNEANTTGAFGIGFIAVYQITDQPHLISNGRHWILNEESSENERIEQCGGCQRCRQPRLPGTRFIFPWAKKDSSLRRALRAQPIDTDAPKRIIHELLDSVPTAILFLRRIRRIEIKRNGRLESVIERVDDSDSLIVSNGTPDNDQVWYLVRGEFDQVAANLRDRYKGRIEDKRSSKVTIAIPESGIKFGLLCAGLPSEHDTGLPFHVNADFFTTNDRKRVIFAQDYQSEWNRAALEAAGRALGAAVERLSTLLGAPRFWELVTKLKEVADKSEQERVERAFGEFWKHVAPKLRNAPVVLTSKSEWATPPETCLLLQKEESSALPVLESLGIKVVHEDLRPYQSILRSGEVGIPVLNIERICAALKKAGLDKRVPMSALPRGLDTTEQRAKLYELIWLLFERSRRTAREKTDDERRLKEVALAPGRDGGLWPCQDIFSADKETVSLFEDLDIDVPFLKHEEGFSRFTWLCRQFDIASAIEVIERADASQLAGALLRNEGRLLQRLFAWLENRREEIRRNIELKSRLVKLPLFPSKGVLHPLDKLALPGDFDDPLGLARLVDLRVLGNRREFLRELGVRELNFTTYVEDLLPSALDDPSITPDERRKALIFLAKHVGELKDSIKARDALSTVELIECTDGQFRRPHECYFESQETYECLGPDIHIASLPAEHKSAIRDLFEWLGVASEPRINDVVNKILALTVLPYSQGAARQIKRILVHLAKRASKEGECEYLEQLKSRKWIPARDRTDRWYAPHELYATYQDYLFESQAYFVDLPVDDQKNARDLFKCLQINITPPVRLVVNHLNYCSDNQIPVNEEVYRFLNQHSADPSVRQLSNKKCLLLDGVYRSPKHVFWGEHPFGRYRWKLGKDLLAYSSLLDVLGVKEQPDGLDALAVLHEISDEFGTYNKSLDDDAYNVLISCWRMIESSFKKGHLAEEKIKELSEVKCVPNNSRILNQPIRMFFEDRPGLKEKFSEFLAHNVIQKPLDAWKAMKVAGVRSLSEAVTVELLECSDVQNAEKIIARIQERSNEVSRVLEAQADSITITDKLDQLKAIQFAWARSITIQYRLSLFNRELYSEKEEVPAVYLQDQNKLLIARLDRQLPWASIARELAIAMFPEEDPGRLAAGLKEALAPDSKIEAAAMLDELGFPRINTDVQDRIKAGQSAETLGIDEPIFTAPYQKGKSLNVDEAIHQLFGGNTPCLMPPNFDQNENSSGYGGRARGGKVLENRNKGERTVLRSYVLSPSMIDELPNVKSEKNQDRSSVEKDGISRVLEYEKTHGRIPKEMPPKNPGYDIESKDLDGNVVRYIEVKSFSGNWKSNYAVITEYQFNKAMELGDRFWLYVVERAQEEESFKIYPIPNPAVRATHFMFDDGWSTLAEDDNKQSK